MNKQNVYLSLLCISVLAFAIIPFIKGIDSETLIFFWCGSMLSVFASAFLLVTDTNKKN